MGFPLPANLDTPSGGAATLLLAGTGDDLTELAALLDAEGYVVVRVPDGATALEHLRQRPSDVAFLSHALADLDGADVCRRAKNDHRTRLIPIVLFVDPGSPAQRLLSLDAGVDGLLSPPLDRLALKARLHSLLRMKRYTDDLESVGAVMMTLSAIAEARDDHTEGHCHRMANYATTLGRRLGLDQTHLETLRRGAFLHDIGMLVVPDDVLQKRSALDDEEMRVVRSHPVVGESLIAHMRSLQPVRTIVRHHHERLDGLGYPDGLVGDQIAVEAQIVGLVDTFEAMTQDRPYQQARSQADTLDVLLDNADRGWYRRELVEHFADILRTR